MKTKNSQQFINASIKALGQVVSLVVPDFSHNLAQAISFSETWEKIEIETN